MRYYYNKKYYEACYERAISVLRWRCVNSKEKNSVETECKKEISKQIQGCSSVVRGIKLMPGRKINKYANSYTLKHLFENILGFYVHEGSLSCALISCGFLAKLSDHASQETITLNFGITKKELKKVQKLNDTVTTITNITEGLDRYLTPPGTSLARLNPCFNSGGSRLPYLAGDGPLI